MSKHTPGPWSVVDGHYPSMREIHGPSFKINIVMSATDLNFQDYLSRSADARLIAAAPDLLEALDGMLMEFNEKMAGVTHDELAAIHAARRAIAKAKGEQE